MSIRYIDCDEARIMPSETEYHVDLEWFGGETVKNLEAKRLYGFFKKFFSLIIVLQAV